jgi:hypothetical protein
MTRVDLAADWVGNYLFGCPVEKPGLTDGGKRELSVLQVVRGEKAALRQGLRPGGQGGGRE